MGSKSTNPVLARIDSLIKKLFSSNENNFCDTCDEFVPPHENVIRLESIRRDNNALPFFYRRRHISCSPSRAQFIVHPNAPQYGITDERPQYNKTRLPYQEMKQLETEYTEAWIQLLKESGLDASQHRRKD